MGRITHGMTLTPAYWVWRSMLARCYNPRNKSYSRYGGRGITVCERWRDSFENFHADMGAPPPGYQLDRINNEGDYKPSNCRWVTAKEQTRNRSNNRYIEYNGERKVLKDWAIQIGISRYALGARLKNGWPLDKALSLPPNKGRRVMDG